MQALWQWLYKEKIASNQHNCFSHNSTTLQEKWLVFIYNMKKQSVIEILGKKSRNEYELWKNNFWG